MLAALTHSVPFVTGTPTVVSEIGKLVYGSSPAGQRPLLRAPGGDRADPHPGGEHQLHRVSLPGELRGRGLLPAAQAHRSGSPVGVLQRDPAPGRGVHRAALATRREGLPRLIPDVRHRGVHRVHHGRRRHGDAPLAAPGPALAQGCGVSTPLPPWSARLSSSSSRSPSSPRGPGSSWSSCRSSSSLSSGRTASTEKRTPCSEEGAAVAACEAKVLRRHVVVMLVDKIDLATARADPVRPDPHSRRSARGAFQHRQQARRVAHLPVAAIRARPSSAGRHRLPGPSPRAGGIRVGCRAEQTARPRSACSCRGAPTARPGGGSSTTRRPTASSTSSASFHTSTRRSSRSTSPRASRRRSLDDGALPRATALATESVDARRLTRPMSMADPQGPEPISALQWRSRAKVTGGSRPSASSLRSDVPTSRVCARRRQRRGNHPRLPRTAIHQRAPQWVDADGRRHGREAPGQAGDDQSGLRTAVPSRSRAWSPDMTPLRDHTQLERLPSAIALGWIWFAALIVPIAVALLLVPSRGHLGPADDALVLGRRDGRHRVHGATGVPPRSLPLMSAASFDFLLTRPYGSFRISRQGDITTEILFVAVGLLVGELAARGRQHQRAAARGQLEISRLHDLGAADRRWRGTGLRAHRRGKRASRAPQPAGLPLRPRAALGKGGLDRTMTARCGSIPCVGPRRTAGLPTRQVELPVRGGGRILGTFLLDTDAGGAHQQEQCLVAVALVDQLGAALANEAS